MYTTDAESEHIDAATLADYRERVAQMYLADTDLATFRRARDELFATRPQPPIPAAERAEFAGVRYFPESPDARVTVAMRQPVPSRATVAHPFQQSAKVEG